MMVEIEKDRFVYFGTIKDQRFVEPIISKLEEIGISKKQIVNVEAAKFAQDGDYIIQPWIPDEPTELIIGRIKKNESLEPQREGDGQSDFVQYDTIARIDFHL